MNDPDLYDRELRGELVSHCRAKCAHDAQLMIERRNHRDLEAAERRRPILRARWAA